MISLHQISRKVICYAELHSKSLRHIADKCYGYGTHDVYNTNINVQSMDSYHAGDIICQQDIGGSLIVLKTDEYIMCIEIDT